VNQSGADLESDNRLTTATNLLPWLQDTIQANVASLWNTAYRDVVILDSSNRVAGVMNLTTYDLTQAANRDRLKALLRATANAGDSDGDKLPDHWEYRSFGGLNATGVEDTDGDGFNNFLELAFGSNPNNSAELPRVNFGFNSANRFQVSFERWAGGASDYLVEMSTNLVDWTGSTVSIFNTSTNYCDGTGRSQTTYNLRRPSMQLPTGLIRINARPKE